MVASLKIQKFVSLVFVFILMKKELQHHFPSPFISSKNPFSTFPLSYNPSSDETRTHDPWFARPVSSPLHQSCFLKKITESMCGIHTLIADISQS